jgi:hypothetical protein
MRVVLRIAGLLVALVVVVMGLSMVASETGEIVTLQTNDAEGKPKETRLWVVDDGGKQWLRAGSPQSSWLLDIQRSPIVQVEREGQQALYTAVPQPELRDRLNPLFAEKYGWADAYIGALFGRDDATPIRLDPR